jgi:sodium/hydrogen antiporter
MDPLSADAFVKIVALVGAIIIVAALLSGLVDRTGLPQVAVFIGLGAVLGPAGLRLLNVGLDSTPLRIVATLSLVLVLFADAITIDIVELRRNGLLSFLVVGPGTILTAALIGLAGWQLLGLAPPAAALLGAALASTDPVLLRNVLRARDLPTVARHALRIESGMNDAVLLPIALVAMAFLLQSSGAAHDWVRFGIDLFLLGPAAGIAVGLVSVATLDLIRRRIGVTRDYESLYAIGTALAAYAAAEFLHGSGFLAAFAAGATIAALDVELCDCFIEYGQTTAEMALLFTFVLLGGSLIWSGVGLLSLPVVLFVVAAVLLRPLVYLVSLAPVRLERAARLTIAWFGPRGLSSLLLVLLAVFQGVPGSDYLFALCSLVVLLSLVVHGGTPLLMSSLVRARNGAEGGALESAPVSGPFTSLPSPLPRVDLPTMTIGDGANGAGHSNADRISIADLRRLWEEGAPVVILDVRTERSFNREPLQAAGSIRMQPDHVAERAQELNLPRDAWIIPYCT